MLGRSIYRLLVMGAKKRRHSIYLLLTHFDLNENVSFNNILLVSITTSLDITFKLIQVPSFKTPTYYQSHKPTCIDNIITNQTALFKLSKTFGTGLLDQYKLISSMMKSGSSESSP